MCGIVGILGRGPVAEQLVDSLKRLEYRGYDSAGVATLEGGILERRRAEGKLKNLEARLQAQPLKGFTGIGHTRWATHGKPTENNAHPHATDRVAVVHNGIIENFHELREALQKKGTVFATETDTEIVVHLVDDLLSQGMAPVDAVRETLAKLRGAFALGFIFAGQDDLLIGARNGPPLAVGYGNGEMYLGSDAIALGPLTDNISYLEDGDWVVLTHKGATVYDRNNAVADREIVKHGPSTSLVDKANYRHFMAKEIHEQPEVVGHTLARYVDMGTERVMLPARLPFDFKDIQRISITACGTASYAGFVAKYWFERFARVPVELDVASEFRYREAPLRKGDLAIFISQSGETADTLAALRYAKAQGVHTLSVVNVPTSTIARESEIVMPTLAGPEIGVASTKAFTCQLMVLAALAIAAGRGRGELSEADETKLVHGLVEVPRLIAAALTTEPQIEKLAREIAKSKDVLYLGRGTSYPLALEGALKLKEISYIHAEGYAAGELKHGPIALIDETMPVVVIAPYDRVFEKTVSNMQEVAARGGNIILMTDAKGAEEATVDSLVTIILPDMAATFTPIVYAIPVQLLAYHTAVVMGTDVDQPRNLAKSVTVE
ncbi:MULTISPECIES: glutamine--fructose-6-phosphate transaminase (isomerizing) [Bradyrhizobium]|jgi:glucosamine--fructose-6-phosphate aminotransferase (isomerizing)|uniref:Glutamine--fructose-6-phosphate aminotransferase [isomerizing] n=1 Tax=Bradyrhizobium denitrificans TaxID=2734912 RepID=A0ABS5G6D8_9BRAD|nr:MULTISPECIES: glutamine--fructose-6-phosphate transaminase (isomerizing) [Bradyrhizobium]RTM02577.1 MAG: glutamine--fructose-6-phosphate transaminase (isomerizing) [Bradyrhizobiaceae bacterium]MBR1136893.1 glutamine--fructose-6-phosphate transaminase (isomerizing) [Bradyrhizobium denitrificans]MCL8488897.1 glutamine--fructose-6-phosphate transaminase (isomerizing) [Bradyrhizobium denitrificans]MDU1493107.1 glutamine--fructose-6-phosphate transaminase (isomerizing) [Bradyrhizobium sp.]MDU154